MAGIHHQAQKHEFSSHSIAFALGFRAGGTERDTRCAAPQCGPWAAPSGKSQQQEEMGSCPAGLRGARGSQGSARWQLPLVRAASALTASTLSSVLQARLQGAFCRERAVPGAQGLVWAERGRVGPPPGGAGRVLPPEVSCTFVVHRVRKRTYPDEKRVSSGVLSTTRFLTAAPPAPEVLAAESRPAPQSRPMFGVCTDSGVPRHGVCSSRASPRGHVVSTHVGHPVSDFLARWFVDFLWSWAGWEVAPLGLPSLQNHPRNRPSASSPPGLSPLSHKPARAHLLRLC